MGRTTLGELEHLIMLAVLRVGSDAYGAAIIAEIEQTTGRGVSHAAVYIALQRMGAKGLLTTRVAKGTTERGGRAKQVFAVTDLGHERLRQSASALFKLWEGLDPAWRSAGGA